MCINEEKRINTNKLLLNNKLNAMKKILIIVALCWSHIASAAYSQTIKEVSLPAVSISLINVSGIQGNYTFAKSNDDSVHIKVLAECKDMKAFSEFAAKYTVNVDEKGGKLSISTQKYSTSLGMLFYEIILPEKMRMELILEEGNVSIKEMEVNMKISQLEGNLFTDNISGVFDLASKKSSITLNTKNILATINSGSSALNFSAKKGKAKINSASGDVTINITNDVEIEAAKKSDDLTIILPTDYSGKMEISSDKKPIHLNFSEIQLTGTLTSQLIKCTAGKGGNMLQVTSNSAQITVGNSTTMVGK